MKKIFRVDRPFLVKLQALSFLSQIFSMQVSTRDVFRNLPIICDCNFTQKLMSVKSRYLFSQKSSIADA